MRLKQHSPISPPQHRLLERNPKYPPSVPNLLKTFEARALPYKFGVSKETIDQQYVFLSQEEVREFFALYLHRNGDDAPGEDFINGFLVETLNWTNDANGTQKSSSNFNQIFRELLFEMREMNGQKMPYIRIVIGPTGSGKTAFSKGLISSCLHDFWAENIIPTRVEYDRFFEHGTGVPPDELKAAINVCQLRDCLLWYYFSSRQTKDIRDDPHLPALKGLSNIPEPFGSHLTTLRNLSDGKVVGEQGFTARDAFLTLREHFDYGLPADFVNLAIREFQEGYGKSFFVSLDGFDTVTTKDFLLAGHKDSPAATVADFLRKTQYRFSQHASGPTSFQTNFIIYLRDTTYNQLRLDFNHKVGSDLALVPKWIAPPSYRSLTESMLGRISRELLIERGEELTDDFARTVQDVFSRHFSNILPSVGRMRPISAVFTWNARNKKRHIVRILRWSLEDLIDHEPGLRRRIETAGMDEKGICEAILRNPNLGDMRAYSINETLYLDPSRQLIPKLSCRSKNLTRHLDAHDLASAVDSVNDWGEMHGFFDCVLNYATEHFSECSNGDFFPNLLIMVRMLQFLELRGSSRTDRLHDFLSKIGYTANIETIDFFALLLLRNEFVAIQPSHGETNFEETDLHITIAGQIVLHRLLPSITYFSECLLVSQLPDEGLASRIKRRSTGRNVDWVGDCIFNATIGLSIIKKIEVVESRCADESREKFGDFRIHTYLRDQMSAEARRILLSRRHGMEEVRSSTFNEIRELRREFEDLDVFDELDRRN